MSSITPVDQELWQKVEALAKGSDGEKAEATAILFAEIRSLPRDAEELLRQLARDPSLEVRMEIGRQLAKKPSIPWTLDDQILDLLSKDTEDKVKEQVATRLKERDEMRKALGLLLTPNLDFAKFVQDTYAPSQQFAEAVSKLSEDFKSITSGLTLDSAKNIQSYLDTINAFKLTVSLPALLTSGSYFPSNELSILSAPPPLLARTRAQELAEQLRACPEGRDNWKAYEDICLDVLNYCIVPPLSEAFVQHPTGDRIQRRDIIFPFPHDRAGFWGFIASTLQSDGVIVDCKNFSGDVEGNDVVIVSKYFGEGLYTRFGMVVTRHGISQSGKTQERRTWLVDKKLIVCLTDSDLVKMLELKEARDDPAKVIDQAYRDFKLSL